MSRLQLGIIREGKIPPDSRVPLTPQQCQWIQENYPIDISVQPSDGRCYSNKEYEEQGISLKENLDHCEILMGVKEVPIDLLIPNKNYFFFSHTIKKQSYNRKLLQACVEKHIRLLDYEVLTNEQGKRLIAFGVFAGMVGAHNGMMTYGRRTGLFDLPQMKDYFDYQTAVNDYQTKEFPKMKIVLTGAGRVGSGAKKVLDDMNIREVEPAQFLNQEFNEAVYTQLECDEYVARKDGSPFVREDFYQNPNQYKSIFKPYTQVADVMINGIYWDNNAPAFFSKEDMKEDDFNIQVIADVTCDIAPISSIPSTIFASTIADPIFGYNPHTEKEDEPHQAHVVDMMTIDNLPNELPRDASQSFGEQFIQHILQEVLEIEKSQVMERASIAKNGNLGSYFEYLRAYLEGKE